MRFDPIDLIEPISNLQKTCKLYICCSGLLTLTTDKKRSLEVSHNLQCNINYLFTTYKGRP